MTSIAKLDLGDIEVKKSVFHKSNPPADVSKADI